MEQRTSIGHPTDIDLGKFDFTGNPFFSSISVTATDEKGSQLSLPAFYVGDGEWRARISFPSEGTWNVVPAHQGREIPDRAMQVGCGSGVDPCKGGITVDRRTGRHFVHRDGTPFFMLSYEADWLWGLEMAYPGEGRVDRFLRHVAQYGFNTILINFFAYDTTWCPGNTSERDYGPPPLTPWEGGNSSPDYETLNLEYFARMDEVLWAFHRTGVFAHLYFKVFNKGVRWPSPGSVEEEAYFRYVVARYQAFPSVIWDFAKETYYEPDKELVKERLRQIGEWDAHSRLRSVHDDLLLSADSDARELIDFITAQQHHDFHASVLLNTAAIGKPYVNAELGYECGPGGELDVSYGVGQLPQELLRRAYKVLLAGGYPSYYYTYTAWDVIDEEAIPPGYEFFRTLYEVATELRVWEFIPDQTLCLWRNSFAMRRNSEAYLLFVQDHVLVGPELSSDRVNGTWMNIHTGERRAVTNAESLVERPERTATGSPSGGPGKPQSVAVTAEPSHDQARYTIYTVPFPTKEALLYLTRK
jgi:hypothetical protein